MCELRWVQIAVCVNCYLWELQFVGVTVCGSCLVGSCGVGELLCVVIAIWGTFIVGDFYCWVDAV